MSPDQLEMREWYRARFLSACRGAALRPSLSSDGRRAERVGLSQHGVSRGTAVGI
jgi:hypothetical protein